ARRRRTDAELDEATVSTVPDIADDPEVALQKKNRVEALRQSLSRLYGQRHDGEPQRLRRRGGTASSVGDSRERNRERHDRGLFAGRQAHHRGGRQGLRYG